MKKLIIILLLFSLAGCDMVQDDSMESNYYCIDYCDVLSVSTGQAGQNTMIRRDDGMIMIVTENSIPGFTITKSDRLIINYSLLEQTHEYQGSKCYNIRLNAAQKIVSKRPVTLSFIKEDETHRQDSIGNDPVDITSVWFGGKYINIAFRIMRKDNDLEHMMNLVENNMQDDMQIGIELTLRRNGYNDPKSYMGEGLISFDLTDQIATVPYGNPITLILKWKDNLGSSHSESWSFMPYADIPDGSRPFPESTPIK